MNPKIIRHETNSPVVQEMRKINTISNNEPHFDRSIRVADKIITTWWRSLQWRRRYRIFITSQWRRRCWQRTCWIWGWCRWQRICWHVPRMDWSRSRVWDGIGTTTSTTNRYMRLIWSRWIAGIGGSLAWIKVFWHWQRWGLCSVLGVHITAQSIKQCQGKFAFDKCPCLIIPDILLIIIWVDELLKPVDSCCHWNASSIGRNHWARVWGGHQIWNCSSQPMV